MKLMSDTEQTEQTQERTRSCHMCGLPSWAISTEGVMTPLRIKAESRFKRDRRIKVWCCGSSCALQSRAVAEMGTATHKWPMTLGQFAALERKHGKDRSDCDETYAQTRINTEAAEAKNEEMSLPHTEHENVTKPRLGGRPREYESAAERTRAYRQRVRSTGPVQPSASC